MKKQAPNTLAADKYVLIVEDSATRAAALKNASQERGWNVGVARDGMEALAMARSKKPAIVISDICMPKIDGYALSKALKTDPALCDVPVVLLTTLSQSSDIIGAINSRADYYFLKQWDNDTLFAKIASILETYQPLPEHGNDALTLRHEGQIYAIDANVQRPLRLLMSTYEIAVQQNLELAAARDKLREINESLEKTVRERTAQLTASEIGYRRLFEAARDGILILDADTGEIIDVNPFMIELLGRSREDFLSRKLWETGLFKDIAASKANFDELRDKGYLRYDDLPLETRDGRRIKAEFVSHAYEVDGKKVIQCNIRDITERKRTEQALAASEERFRTAAESLMDVVYDWDLKKKVDWYGNIDGLMGYPPGEFPRTIKGWQATIHPEDKDRVMAALEGHLKGGAPFVVEYRVGHKNGEWRWWSARGAAIRDDRGEPYKMIGAITDITARKLAEQALLDSETRYRTLFEHSADGILISDNEGKVLKYANSAICRMLGYTEDELRTLGVSNIHPKDDLPRVAAEFEAQARGEKTLATDIPCLRKDGTVFFADVTAVTVDLDGSKCMVGFFRDVTGRKQTEAEMMKQMDELRRWQTATLGREGRILAVKKEVNELLARLGEPSRYPSAEAT